LFQNNQPIPPNPFHHRNEIPFTVKLHFGKTCSPVAREKLFPCVALCIPQDGVGVTVSISLSSQVADKKASTQQIAQRSAVPRFDRVRMAL
jgi:hypothetical protein